MIRLGLVMIASAGCVDISNEGAPWVEVSAITGSLAPEIGSSPPPRAPPGCTLRIASWNVHFGEDPANLAAQIQASAEISRADVIVVQEIEQYPQEPVSRAHRLADALGMTWIYAPARNQGDGTHGLAVFSRYPLEAAQVRELPFIDRPKDPKPRIAVRAEVVLGTDRVQIVDVHLETRLSPGDRISQLHPAVNDVDERMALGGDFNTQPWSWVGGLVPLTSTEAVIGQDHARIVDDYLGNNRLVGAIPPDVGTMRIPVFDMRLDNLYARGLPILAAGVEHVDGSDHWPVWFDVDRCAR